MERVQFIFFITDGYKESFSILTKGKEKKSPPGSSIHGLFQARILEQVGIPFSGESSQPGDQTLHCRQILYYLETSEKPNIRQIFSSQKREKKERGVRGGYLENLTSKLAN